MKIRLFFKKFNKKVTVNKINKSYSKKVEKIKKIIIPFNSEKDLGRILEILEIQVNVD